MTTELQTNRYDQLLRRVGDLKGPGSKVSEVLSELFPVIDVERPPGELLALMQTTLGVGTVILQGAAGQTAKGQLFNAADSGKLITVTSVILVSDTTQILRLAIANASLTAGIAVEIPRDIRFGFLNRPVGAIFQETSAGVVNGNIQFRTLANQPTILRDENDLFVIPPGFGLTAGTNDLATELNVVFFWRERTAEPSELNL